MIRAFLEATGAVWWACAAIVLAVVGIGLLRAFWREWRAPRCRYCFVPVNVPAKRIWWGWNLCPDCYAAWHHRHDRLPREVMG